MIFFILGNLLRRRNRMDYEKQLSELNLKLNQAKDKRNKATWRLEELKKEQEVLEKKIRELGLEPEELEGYINSLEKDILSLLDEAKSLLPDNI